MMAESVKLLLHKHKDPQLPHLKKKIRCDGTHCKFSTEGGKEVEKVKPQSYMAYYSSQSVSSRVSKCLSLKDLSGE